MGRDNHFNLLRAAAAVAVLVSHAWPIALGTGTPEPLAAATGYKLGSTAVSVFFAVSGFFICKSFVRRASVLDFAAARVARIYPALLVVLVATTLLLGPLLTDRPIARFLLERRTWTYLPRNLLLAHPQWDLPGVFARHPAGAAINGSLWTLYYEVGCYGGVALLGLAGLLRRSVFWLVVVAAAVATLAVPQGEHGGAPALASILFLPFALGAAAYLYADRVPLTGWLLGALVALAAAVGTGSPLYPALHAAAVSYGALWLGFAWRSPRGQARRTDTSYGIYIYAFPVEQLVVRLIPAAGPWTVIALALPATLILAALSWRLVEKPALDRRRWLSSLLRAEGRRRVSPHLPLR